MKTKPTLRSYGLIPKSFSQSNIGKALEGCNGIIIPGGFGSRGFSGMLLAANYARTKNIPFFGIGMGMSAACVEFARNVLNISDADSAEFDEKTKNPVIILNQANGSLNGGEMRLGAYGFKIKSGTLLERAYGAAEASERHRHRYQFNGDYAEAFEKKGMTVSAVTADGKFVEAIEISGTFFVGVLYNPEFKSRPTKAHPLFKEFVGACLKSGK